MLLSDAVPDEKRNPMLTSQSSRFAALQSRIDGQVLVAGDDAWDASRQTFNVTHDQQPAALVRVASAEDVAKTVRYAARHGLRDRPAVDRTQRRADRGPRGRPARTHRRPAGGHDRRRRAR